jgi:hypothetical protein
MPLTPTELSRRVESALEEARLRAVAGLSSAGLPLSLTRPAAVMVDDGQGGSRSEYVMQKISGLCDRRAEMAIADISGPNAVLGRLIGFRDELTPVDEYLDAETNLGRALDEGESGMFPAHTGAEAILTRYLANAAIYYLKELPDLAERSDERITEIVRDVQLLAQEDHTRYVVLQIPVGNIRVQSEYRYKDVRVRPTTGIERGIYMLRQANSWVTEDFPGVEHLPGGRFRFFDPTLVVEIEQTMPRGSPIDHSLASRMALAFFLLGWTLSCDGSLISFARPRWAGLISWNQAIPFPVFFRPAGDRVVDDQGFSRSAINRIRGDLARQCPPRMLGSVGCCSRS